MIATITTQPAAEPPVSIYQAKDHLRIEDSRDDPTIVRQVAAAAEYIEQQTGQALVTRTLDATLDGFPVGPIRLPHPPLLAVDEITYIDPMGEVQTFDAGDYHVDTARQPGRIVPRRSWPATDQQPAAVRITYQAGYGTADDVPQLLKQGILLLAGHWFENREATTPLNLRSVPMAVESIISTHHFPEVV